MKHLFDIPASFADLSDDELRSFIAGGGEAVQRAHRAPEDFSAEFTPTELLEAATELVSKIEEAKAVLASRADEVEVEAEPAEAAAEDVSARMAELADRAQAAADEAAATTAEADEAAADEVEEAAAEEPEGEPEGDDEAEPEAEPEAEASVQAAAQPAPTTTTRRALAKPARSRRSVPAPVAAPTRITLTAAAEGLGYPLGAELGSSKEARLAIARMMIKRRGQFGTIAEGTHGDTVPIARADWSEQYPEDRRLGDDLQVNMEKIEAVTASAKVKASFDERVRKFGADSLVAAGGLCAPLTPYYGLQEFSTNDRPVRDGLATFNADRGGIIAARPAALTAIDGAVGIITMDDDAAGGSAGEKTCQVIDCPDFNPVEIEAIYHCLQVGNILARTFPELVDQWNQLLLAAQARVAETNLLNKIKAASTAVTAGSDGLGASATLPSQIATAAVAFRSRHRMEDDAVLRVMLPFWVLDLLVSDVYRSQFQRFDMTPEQFVALLRRHNVEPSFYKDGPSDGVGQVFAAQTAGTLLAFPSAIQWALFPEGSFLFLDGGMLELGLVRDSVLNRTNDYQLFGESFENVAFVGVESLWVTTTTCDSGQVNAPVNSGCISY